ncbi:MAG: ornithine carbamoyltransferase [Coriobacteriales bacterium]|jgi:ornithine carbamoyltransferase|nr:ornithine carbamoyltransferase [Coriobacteriales bacterium]
MSDWSHLNKPALRLEKNPLAGRDLLRLSDLLPEELHLLLSTAFAQKQAATPQPAAPQTAVSQPAASQAATPQPAAFQKPAPYLGKAVAIILEKPSLRTRVSFELAATRLGAQPIVLSGPDSAFSRGESVQDTTLVLERFVSALVLRTFAQTKLEEVAAWASVPVINALSDDFHPCQLLADLLTIYEHKGRLCNLKLAYVGDGNNMANSYLEAAALTGLTLAIATPKGYEPNEGVVRKARQMAAATGANLSLGTEMAPALAAADVVITDTWASMGSEDSRARRLGDFAGYTIDAAAMQYAAADALFLHCLPAHRGEEVTDEVMDASYSAIYDEAENRLHVQQALLSLLLADG